ncbi:uncharacterized protein [Diadema antillarum]|uniref:uncharacterized protein n=1 Tax=Diadema antillarum TaxID=105358 RepID=UPI003A8760DF
MPRESSGHGHGCREDQSSLTASPLPSPSDGDDGWSVASVTVSVASTSPGPALPKKKRVRKVQFVLEVHEEQLMCDFIRKNNILWDIKKTGYRRLDKKAKLWRDQAKIMGKTAQHLQGWFKSVRDTHTRLDRIKGGEGARELTEREQWVKANFSFLKTVVRHRARSMNAMKATTAAHSRDHETAKATETARATEATKATEAAIVIDDDSMPPSVPSSSSQPTDRHGQEDDPLLQSLQKKVTEFEELFKSLSQPQPISAAATFANYVRDSLLGMSKRKFRKARSRINIILGLLDLSSGSDAADSISGELKRPPPPEKN